MLQLLDLESPKTQNIASSQTVFALVLLKSYTEKKILNFTLHIETECLFSI